MTSADWERLLQRLDYHAKSWYENDGDIWFKIDRRRAMRVMLDLGYSPNTLMKQFGYRDRESHPRSRINSPELAQGHWF